MRKKRDRKEQKADQKKYYDGLEAKTDEKALADFRIPANQRVRVSEYIRRKYGKGSVAVGQEMSEKVPSELKRAAESGTDVGKIVYAVGGCSGGIW